MRARRLVRAADRLRWLLNDFRESCPKVHLQAIKRRGLIGYMAQLRERGRDTLNTCAASRVLTASFGVANASDGRESPLMGVKLRSAENTPLLERSLQANRAL
jgi:hypothetical protein